LLVFSPSQGGGRLNDTAKPYGFLIFRLSLAQLLDCFFFVLLLLPAYYYRNGTIIFSFGTFFINMFDFWFLLPRFIVETYFFLILFFAITLYAAFFFDRVTLPCSAFFAVSVSLLLLFVPVVDAFASTDASGAAAVRPPSAGTRWWLSPQTAAPIFAPRSWSRVAGNQYGRRRHRSQNVAFQRTLLMSPTTTPSKKKEEEEVEMDTGTKDEEDQYKETWFGAGRPIAKGLRSIGADAPDLLVKASEKLGNLLVNASENLGTKLERGVTSGLRSFGADSHNLLVNASVNASAILGAKIERGVTSGLRSIGADSPNLLVNASTKIESGLVNASATLGANIVNASANIKSGARSIALALFGGLVGSDMLNLLSSWWAEYSGFFATCSKRTWANNKTFLMILVAICGTNFFRPVVVPILKWWVQKPLLEIRALLMWLWLCLQHRWCGKNRGSAGKMGSSAVNGAHSTDGTTTSSSDSGSGVSQ
jgi:hypothetical protein